MLLVSKDAFGGRRLHDEPKECLCRRLIYKEFNIFPPQIEHSTLLIAVILIIVKFCYDRILEFVNREQITISCSALPNSCISENQ